MVEPTKKEHWTNPNFLQTRLTLVIFVILTCILYTYTVEMGRKSNNMESFHHFVTLSRTCWWCSSHTHPNQVSYGGRLDQTHASGIFLWIMSQRCKLCRIYSKDLGTYSRNDLNQTVLWRIFPAFPALMEYQSVSLSTRPSWASRCVPGGNNKAKPLIKPSCPDTTLRSNSDDNTRITSMLTT